MEMELLSWMVSGSMSTPIPRTAGRIRGRMRRTSAALGAENSAMPHQGNVFSSTRKGMNLTIGTRAGEEILEKDYGTSVLNRR
jgi:hypothetical protein